MEIGSIYEINPRGIPDKKKSGSSGFALGETEKYGKKNVVFTMSGRAAIVLALRSIAENRPEIEKKCLLPAYMCDTVFFPFEQEGWRIYFYHVNKKLEADEEELSRLMERIRPGLLFIHAYYGVDTWKPMRSLFQRWKAQGVCIMEDVTQSYYLEGIGKEADYVVGSLRKWYPVPDGGFAASGEPLIRVGIYPEEEFTEKRMELLTEKWEYLYGAGSPEEKKEMKTDFLKKNREMEEWLDRYKGIGGISGLSAGMLSKVNEEECRNKRKENYRYLYGRLRGKRQLWPILSDDEDRGTAPLYLAVYAKDREELQSFLIKHDIYAPVLWPVGRENRDCLTEDEKYIYRHMLALPIDQRYGRQEMERIEGVLDEYELLTNRTRNSKLLKEI